MRVVAVWTVKGGAGKTASVVERMGLTRAPVAATLPSQPVARAFSSLWSEVAARFGIWPAVRSEV